MLVILAATAALPWWYILVFIIGAGGLGGGIMWAFRSARHLAEVLGVLRGSPGGNGTRPVKPLVEVVDSLAASVDVLKAGQEAMMLEIQPNGGNSNRLGDQVVKMKMNMDSLGKVVNSHIVTDTKIWTELSDAVIGLSSSQEKAAADRASTAAEAVRVAAELAKTTLHTAEELAATMATGVQSTTTPAP